MTLEQLRQMRESGSFHHATYRNEGTLWEGLWIYAIDSGLRGFRDVGCFAKDSPDLDAAYELVRNTGVSVGSFGAG